MLYYLISELCSSDTGVEKQLPQLDTLVSFYDKICKILPVDELLPELVAQCVITKDNETRIAVSGKTKSERTQYLLDHYIARPLSAGDPSSFHKLLHVMSSSPKCKYLISDIQQHLSTATSNQKFSGELCNSLIDSYYIVVCISILCSHIVIAIIIPPTCKSQKLAPMCMPLNKLCQYMQTYRKTFIILVLITNKFLLKWYHWQK